MPDARRLAIAALALAAVAAPAAAHHGWASYEPGETTVSGVVQSAGLGNPHGLLKVRDAQGRSWDVMLAPPAAIARSGLTAQLVPAGARVTADGHRHTDPKVLEIKTERLTVNGRIFDLYPARD
jgi:hypothetical protein